MTVNILPVLPILLPLFLSALSMAFRKHTKALQVISISGAALLCLLSCELMWDVLHTGTKAVYLGNWAPPFGITLVADLLSSTLVLTTSSITFIIMLFSLSTLSQGEQERGFYAFAFVMITGVNGAFLTGDIFNLYVWFEVMLISSFALLTLGRKKDQIQAAITYVVLNMIKTMLLLTSIALLYGTVGTLNMGDLHLAVQDIFNYGNPETLKIVALLMLCTFGIKAGIFPLYFWLPASYHTPSPVVGSLFAALLTKVGVYCMLRLFTLVLPFDQLELLPLLSIIALATMLFPIFAALQENNLKRLLAFCLLSHIGVMLMGLAVFNQTSFSGTVLYLVHHMFIMAYLFLIVGMVCHFFQSDDLRLMGGLMKLKPKMAWLLFIPCIALSGMPPFSGFWPKLLLVQGGLEHTAYLLVLGVLVTGIMTLYVMIRVWHQVAWRPYPSATAYYTNSPTPKSQWVPIVTFCVITILLGIYPEPLVHIAQVSGHSLYDSFTYVDAVTGGAP